MEDGKVMNKLEVIYEDNSIIVVNKPCNILSQEDDTKDISLLTMVKEYIKNKYNKPGNVYIGLVHRLDRPVSGVMVFARNSKSARRLTDQIKENKFHKTYYAVVKGILEKDKDTFIDYLKKENNGNTIITDKDNGKYSELSYEVVNRNIEKNETLVKINLKTGRHHQIRVQFASRNYPLCGDQRYGKVDKTQIALVAKELEFYHPIKKELLKFEINLPNRVYFNDFH